MQDVVRSEFRRQRQESTEIGEAKLLTVEDIRVTTTAAIDRDDLLPLREIVAAMLGLDARCRHTGHGWAKEYLQYVGDATARELLAKLVKWTNLLADELKTGVADLKPTDSVRVDKVLDFAIARGWSLPAHMQHAAMPTEPIPAAVLPTQAGAVAPAVGVNSAIQTSELPHWKMLAQGAAAEHWKALRASGANPTVSSITAWVARWCIENRVFTDGGINPSANYLRTHVLGGKHWTSPR